MLVLNLEQLAFRPGATATTQAAPSARAQHYFTSVSYFGAFLNKPVQAIPALHRMSQAWALPSRLNRVPSDVEREVELVSLDAAEAMLMSKQVSVAGTLAFSFHMKQGQKIFFVDETQVEKFARGDHLYVDLLRVAMDVVSPKLMDHLDLIERREAEQQEAARHITKNVLRCEEEHIKHSSGTEARLRAEEAFLCGHVGVPKRTEQYMRGTFQRVRANLKSYQKSGIHAAKLLLVMAADVHKDTHPLVREKVIDLSRKVRGCQPTPLRTHPIANRVLTQCLANRRRATSSRGATARTRRRSSPQKARCDSSPSCPRALSRVRSVPRRAQCRRRRR